MNIKNFLSKKTISILLLNLFILSSFVFPVGILALGNYGWTVAGSWAITDQSNLTGNGINGDWKAVNALRSDNTFADYTVTANMKVLSKDNTKTEWKYGFYAWYKDSNNYVVAWINKDSRGTFVTSTGLIGNQIISPEWREGTVTDPIDITADNSFKTVKIGEVFTFYVNNKQILSTTVLGTSGAAGYGFNVFNVQVQISNLSLSQYIPVNTYGWTFAGDWTATNQSALTVNGIGGGWKAVNATRSDNTFSDYNLTATMKVLSKDNTKTEWKYGFYAWYKDSTNYVVAWINKDARGTFVTATGLIGNQVISPEWREGTVSDPIDIMAENTFKVLKNGEFFTFYVNAKQILTTEISGTSGIGGYGFNVFNAEVQISNLSLEQFIFVNTYGWTASGDVTTANEQTVTLNGLNGGWQATWARRPVSIGTSYAITATVKNMETNTSVNEFWKYGFYPWYVDTNNFLQVYIDIKSSKIATTGIVNGVILPWELSALPSGDFDFGSAHQIKITRQDNLFVVYIDNEKLFTKKIDGVMGNGSWGLDVFKTKTAYSNLSIRALNTDEIADFSGFSLATGAWQVLSANHIIGDAATQNNGVGRGWDLTNIIKSEKYNDYIVSTTIRLDKTGTLDSFPKFYVTAWYKDSNNWFKVYIDPFTTSVVSEAVINGQSYPWRQSGTFDAGFDFSKDHQLKIEKRSGEFKIYMDGKFIGIRHFAALTGSGSVGYGVFSCRAEFKDITVSEITNGSTPLNYGWQNYYGNIEFKSASSLYLGSDYSRFDSNASFLPLGNLTNYSFSALFTPDKIGIETNSPKYGFYISYKDTNNWARCYIDALIGSVSVIVKHSGVEEPWESTNPLKGFDKTKPHTLTMKRFGNELRIYVDGKYAYNKDLSVLQDLTDAYVGIDSVYVGTAVSNIKLMAQGGFSSESFAEFDEIDNAASNVSVYEENEADYTILGLNSEGSINESTNNPIKSTVTKITKNLNTLGVVFMIFGALFLILAMVLGLRIFFQQRKLKQ